MTKPKILVCTEFTGLKSGYAFYFRNLISRIHKLGYDITEFASYISEDKIHEFPIPEWPIYCNVPNQNSPEVQAYNSDPLNQFGAFRFNQVCLKHRPTHIWAGRDVWMDSFIEASPFRRFYNWNWLVPADGFPLNEEWLGLYSDADHLLTYTNWSKDLIEEQSGGKIKVSGVASPCPSDDFHPLNKNELKKRIGDFRIIGTVMRNQKRKLYPSLFEAFRKYLTLSGREDILLYCHTSFPDLGWDIPKLLLQNGLSSKVLFTYTCKNCKHWFSSFFSDAITTCVHCGKISAGLVNVNNGLSDSELCKVYNLFDLYIQFASNEGFGIPIIEAASCSVPVWSIDYSAPEDVIRKIGGFPLKPLCLQDELETGRNWAVADVDNLVENLVKFFNLPEGVRRRFGENSRKLCKEHYNWDTTVKQWENCILSSPVKDRWDSPPNFIQYPPFQNVNCSNAQYLRYLIVNVLGRPDKIGSYLESRLLRQLNYGFINNHTSSNLLDDSSFVAKGQIHSFTRENCYNYLKGMADFNNYWERVRVT